MYGMRFRLGVRQDGMEMIDTWRTCREMVAWVIHILTSKIPKEFLCFRALICTSI
jgi:hypothetical protein